MFKLQNYIAGRLQATDDYLDCFEPATGEIYCQIPRSGGLEVQLAVDAAAKAFDSWSCMAAEDRSAVLLKIADLIDRDATQLAQAESKDNGKPVKLAATIEIPRAASNFRFFAKSIVAFSSQSHSAEGTINFTLRKPHGVVGCIAPWNLPLYLFTWKIAPALAAGNCVVAKPSEMTPYTASMLSELCIEAGLPPGVLNIVHGLGSEAGAAIVEHPWVKAVSFTGGTATGKLIGRVCSDQFKKVSLELGGKNPTVVFADCDFEKMLDTVVRSSFANQGQICLCGSRLLIEKSIYQKFKREFVSCVQKLSVGDPKEDVNLGAVVSLEHRDKVLSYIQLAKEEGGTVLAGGESPQIAGRCKNGWFVSPTVLEGLSPQCRVNQEEIFGPVVTLIPFEGAREALEIANSTDYGLACSVWTENLKKAHQMADQLEMGIVWVNCWLNRDLRTPFGGMKNSGLGREGGIEALTFFTEPKNICIDYS